MPKTIGHHSELEDLLNVKSVLADSMKSKDITIAGLAKQCLRLRHA